METLPAVVILPLAGIAIAMFASALFFFRSFERLAERTLQRKFADLALHPEPLPGDVILTYHTYHGFLVWFTQTEYRVALPPDDARKLLGRLLRFNLAWGLVSRGAAFIAPLSILSYFAQRRSIARQQVASGMDKCVNQPATATDDCIPNHWVQIVDEARESTSPVLELFGWIAGGMSILFGFVTGKSLVTEEFGTGFGGLLLTALLLWVAEILTGNRPSQRSKRVSSTDSRNVRYNPRRTAAFDAAPQAAKYVP